MQPTRPTPANGGPSGPGCLATVLLIGLVLLLIGISVCGNMSIDTR
jgi:hypothetical protein